MAQSSEQHMGHTGRTNETTLEMVRDKLKDVSFVFFDVDGTLIDDNRSKGTVWGMIHALANVSDETRKEREASHRRGDITYEEWMSLDIADWKRAGLTKNQILDAFSSLHLSKGAEDTVLELHTRGYHLGLVSSSIDVGILSMLDEDLFQEFCINRLFFNKDDRISGWDTSACRLEEKGERLKKIASDRGSLAKEFAFVGNDFNDVGAARYAGVSFAFNSACGELNRVATFVDSTGDMRTILSLFPMEPSLVKK